MDARPDPTLTILELTAEDMGLPTDHADPAAPTDPDRPAVAAPTPDAFATAVIARCLEAGADAVLFLPGALPPAFFDLRTRLAGELLQKLANYRLRMAAVVPELAEATARSASFRDFAREANAGRLCRLAPDRDAALAWLEDA